MVEKDALRNLRVASSGTVHSYQKPQSGMRQKMQHATPSRAPAACRFCTGGTNLAHAINATMLPT
jgi:hypothetical protein